MNLIIINGSGGTGKDTFVKECEKFLKKYNIKTFNYSTIEPIKNIMRQYLEWNGAKTEKDRKFMSDMKKLFKEYNNLPFNYVINKFHNKKYPLYQKKIFFIHTREPEEIQEFIKYFNQDNSVETIVTVLICRIDHQILSNESDRNVNKFNYDYIINNNETIDEFKQKAIKFSKEFIKERKNK